jgi:hypothetical protein
MYGLGHDSSLIACLSVFDAEYNEEWPAAFEALEAWVEKHDENLGASERSANDA